MASANDVREALVALNASAAFNRWAGLELGTVAAGAVGGANGQLLATAVQTAYFRV